MAGAMAGQVRMVADFKPEFRQEGVIADDENFVECAPYLGTACTGAAVDAYPAN